MIRELKEDLYRSTNSNKSKGSKIDYIPLLLKQFFISSSFRSILFYRIASSDFLTNKNRLRKLFLISTYLFSRLKIPPTTKIGQGIFIPHPECIVIHSKAIIGKNCTILQGVTIGGNTGKKKGRRSSPTIGDNVLVGAGAKILGPVSVGNNCMIGANAVVVHDIPNDSVAVGIPAKVVKRNDKLS